VINENRAKRPFLHLDNNFKPMLDWSTLRTKPRHAC
jgi:hypothetical protein